MKKQGFPAGKTGFTLVELLVSMAILTLLMLMLVSMTDATRRTWSYTNSKVEQFRDAREAFESITRKLSQATLNTYWDYDNPNSPTRYQRQSELRFISGNFPDLPVPPGSTISPTHAIFFQAPLGYVSNATSYSNLDELLNTWGYFIEFGDDSQLRPSFVTSQVVPYHSRFRLMEMMEPSDSLSLYKYSNGKTIYSGTNSYTGTEWFYDPLKLRIPPAPAPNRPVRPLAENIVALVILPKLSPSDQAARGYTDTSLAPAYRYDSTGYDATGLLPTVSNSDLNPQNQLPPIIQVTMVAVDEASFNRFQTGTSMPDLGLATLFQSVGDTVDSKKPGYAHDLQKLETTLQTNKLNYRVFTSNVSLKSAKWSREQKN